MAVLVHYITLCIDFFEFGTIAAENKRYGREVTP
jgi:hypothetical protein